MGQGEQAKGSWKAQGHVFGSFLFVWLFLESGREGWGVLVNGGRGRKGWIFGVLWRIKVSMIVLGA